MPDSLLLVVFGVVLGAFRSVFMCLCIMKFWKPCALPKVKAFTWTADLNHINTIEMLQKRRPFMSLSPHWCVLCKKELESTNHLFLHCSFAEIIWSYFLSNQSRMWVMPESLVDAIC